MRAGVAGGIVVTTLPIACGNGGAATLPGGPIAAGNVSAVPLDSLRVISGDNAVLGRDLAGLYAMTAVCTHAGCVVAVAPVAINGLNCPCHGSAYDRYGAVMRGPAGRPLQHYRVDVADDGSITIQGDEPVASTDRTPIP
jgi:Rieske Fe-S protein